MPPLQLTLEGDTDVIVTRQFNAPPENVYRAHLEPELICQWMASWPGWTMPVCESDPREGGTFRFELDGGEEGAFTTTGEYTTLKPSSLIVHVERMHMPDPAPDNHCHTTFERSGSGTRLTLKMSLPDSETRQGMMDMGVADGMELSFAKLDEIAS